VIEFIKHVLLVLAIFAAYGIVGRLDYEVERAIEAEREVSHFSQMLAECLNGKLVLTYDNATGRGYGKTAVVCRPAEEFPI